MKLVDLKTAMAGFGDAALQPHPATPEEAREHNAIMVECGRPEMVITPGTPVYSADELLGPREAVAIIPQDQAQDLGAPAPWYWRLLHWFRTKILRQPVVISEFGEMMGVRLIYREGPD